MRLAMAATALGATVLALVVGECVAAHAQDFSITNTIEPADAGRRTLTRQLQEWWDVHGYYPRHAAQNDEGGRVKLHLVIRPDGNIFRVDVAESSGSPALDGAGAAAFRGGFVKPFPDGMPGAEIDIALRYVVVVRRDQPVAAGMTPAASRRGFTITNERAGSPILETMLQRTCAGTVVRQGVRNHPAYGTRHEAEAVFFRKPDGTPWVKFLEGGFPILAPVVEVGKLVQWSGRKEFLGNGIYSYTQYSVWPEGESKLDGNIETFYSRDARSNQPINRGGTVDFTCANAVVPAVAWSAYAVTPIESPVGDPP